MKTTLTFPTMKDLCDFKAITKPTYVHLNTKNCNLTCNCSEADIELAVRGFNAVVIYPLTF
jgi:hypothetical protein